MGYTHSLRVVYEGICLVVAEADVHQVLHPVLPLLARVALETGQGHMITEHTASDEASHTPGPVDISLFTPSFVFV